MKSNPTLICIGQFDFKLNHLLIIGILSLSFSTSFLLRSQPADWGWELHEFDPFYNYRATQYVVENGIENYFQWHDELSWHPDGRNVSHTSQVVLHLWAAITYWIFGEGTDLYDFVILFPVVFGSLTTVVVFALVRVIGGTASGLLASLFFSISLPIIIRGQMGWFKSEPLGLFLSLLAAYLLLSGIKSENRKFAFVKIISAGISLILGLSAWGGNQFFILAFGIFFLVLPFMRNDHKFLVWAIPLFTTTSIIASFGIERLSFNLAFIKGLGGFGLIIPTMIFVVCLLIQHKSSDKFKARNGLVFLLTLIMISSISAVLIIDNELLPMPSHRYVNALNPFLTTTDPLVDSVSEHATPTTKQSFFFHSVLMIFAAIGIWLLLKNSKQNNLITNDMVGFSLIFGIIAVYVSSTFIRLEIFASLSLIIFASLGISILLKEFFSRKNEMKNSKNSIMKFSITLGLIILLVIPLVFPTNSTIYAILDKPPTILNGGTNYELASTDWNDSLEWIKNNTSEDSVIGSWWDYGYWIQTKAERATLADNSTLDTKTIQKIAEILISSPDDGWKSLEEMDADYFVLFLAGQRLIIDGNDDQPLYILQGGGDETKKQWFMKIANQPLEKFLHSDGITGTDYFWNETLMGKMIPFSTLGYINLYTNEQSPTYIPGFTPIYEKDIKYSLNGDGPLKMVYSSKSFDVEKGKILTAVFVYEINKDFVPLN